MLGFCRLLVSRHAAKGGCYWAVFKCEYRFTEYDYEVRFFWGGCFLAFFVLVLSPPWRAVLVIDFDSNRREFTCRRFGLREAAKGNARRQRLAVSERWPQWQAAEGSLRV